MEQEINILSDFLEWFIALQDEKGKLIFNIDNYIELKQKIPFLTKAELIAEINNKIDTSSIEFDNLLMDFYNSPKNTIKNA